MKRQCAWARLRSARLRREMSQAELAEKAGLVPSWISHFEAGRRLPSLEVFRKLCIALGVTADSLLGLRAGREGGSSHG